MVNQKLIAIRGDKNRGNEVIALLEMLGGVNRMFNHTGTAEGWYFISINNNILYIEHLFEEPGFTLDEFNKKYPFKVGDIITYTKFGEGKKEFPVTIETMRWTGEDVEYTLNNCVTCLAKDLKMYYKKNLTENVDMNKEIVVSIYLNNEDYADEVELQLGDYEIEVRDGKTYAVKKKPVYPDNYEECVRITKNIHGYDINIDAPVYRTLMESFIKLLICRDAYWKIVGKQMGLDKPWEPDFTNDEERYGIYTAANKVVKDFCGVGDVNIILTFPIEEMRDTFYENFKDLIEQCKELL